MRGNSQAGKTKFSCHSERSCIGLTDEGDQPLDRLGCEGEFEHWFKAFRPNLLTDSGSEQGAPELNIITEAAHPGPPYEAQVTTVFPFIVIQNPIP